MKGIIDKESGTTLNRILERLLDRGQPGLLNLTSQPEGKKATLEMGADEVRHVNFENLSGDEAIKAIHALPLWSFEFTAVNRQPVTVRGPKVLRPVVKAPARIEVADLPAGETRAVEVVSLRAIKPIAQPAAMETVAATPEPVIEPKAPEPVAPPADPVAESNDTGLAVLKFSFDGTNFIPATHAADDQEFLKGDCYFLYHQARAIGRCMGLTTLQALAYAEDRGARTIAYRMQRGSAFRGVQAEEHANALQILAAI